VWTAIGHKDRAPTIDYPALRIVRMSGEARTEGVEEHPVEGVAVKVYGPAKTVADCFKFRSKVGLGVALDALRDYHRRQARSMDDLWHHAGVCNVQSVIRPYMEAVV
jgi:predicted transcriptional regulator of viral defense system